MPKVIAYTAPWLSRPAPGSSIFTDSTPDSPTSPSKRPAQLYGTNGHAEYNGPRRLIARRGTEIFAVVGNKIRWADLATVRNIWEEYTQTGRGKTDNEHIYGEQNTAPYRILSAPVYYPIRQLIISPSGVFLAICTQHTVHVAVLPDPSRLSEQDDSPLKLKTFQLGPTTHVIPESPLVSGLWHPLSTSTDTTDCFVTVTAESAVRVWELDRSNRVSFERPALAIDLKKLADGVSCDEDFEPAAFGQNKGFSADAFDMEASAACFGGQGLEEEDAWAAMTLWVAMRNGDVYALCPLLPTKWRPTSTTIPSLSTSVVSNMASIEDDLVGPEERQAVQQQYEWVQDLDNDEPLEALAQNGDERFEIRIRPAHPSAIPRLQGPFEFADSDDLTDLEVTDIAVIAGRVDEDAFLSGEDGYADRSETQDGLPFALICLATTDRLVHIAMDMESVTGQWLPKRGRNTFSVPVSETKELILLDTVWCRGSNEPTNAEWPMFTPDLSSRYNLLLTTSTQVLSLSLATWSTRLSSDLSVSEDNRAGLENRLRLACQTQICVDEALLTISDGSISAADDILSAPVVLDDINLGYMLLTATPSQAYSLTFDKPQFAVNEQLLSQSLNLSHSSAAFAPTLLLEAETAPSDTQLLPQRSPYTPHNFLYQSSTKLLTTFTTNVAPMFRATLKQDIRLSPATLDIMTCAHRILSKQTSQLEMAVAELFRRCERLRDELGDQVKQMCELADRLQHLNGHEDDPENNKVPDTRLRRAQDRQKKLMLRFEELRRNAARATNVSRDLSAKERGWVAEVHDLAVVVGVDQSEESESPTVEKKEENENGKQSLTGRFEQIKSLATALLEESKHFTGSDSTNRRQQHGPESRPSTSTSTASFSTRLQKSRIADAMAMVEREGAVIEAVMARLEKLAV